MSGDDKKVKHLQENKKVVESFIELAWNKGRFNLARNLVRRDFKYHASLVNQTFGYDTAMQVIQMIRQSMDDFEVILEEIVAEGDKVVTQSSFCGVLVKPMLGFKPTPNVVNLTAMSFWEMKKGEVQSVSTLLDTAELMRQMPHETKDLTVDMTDLTSK